MSDHAYEGFLDSIDIGYNADGGDSLELTIKAAQPANTAQDASGKVVDRPVIAFEEKINGQHKAMILNRTNIKSIKLIHGHYPSEWIGKKITVAVKFVDAFGQVDAPALRVLPPAGLPLPVGMRKWMGRDKPKAIQPKK